MHDHDHLGTRASCWGPERRAVAETRTHRISTWPDQRRLQRQHGCRSRPAAVRSSLDCPRDALPVHVFSCLPCCSACYAPSGGPPRQSKRRSEAGLRAGTQMRMHAMTRSQGTGLPKMHTAAAAAAAAATEAVAAALAASLAAAAAVAAAAAAAETYPPQCGSRPCCKTRRDCSHCC